MRKFKFQRFHASKRVVRRCDLARNVPCKVLRSKSGKILDHAGLLDQKMVAFWFDSLVRTMAATSWLRFTSICARDLINVDARHG